MEQSPLDGFLVNKSIKQVLILRHDLLMRCGKQIAQGSHGSIAWLLNLVRSNRALTADQWMWINEGQTKIVVRVESETELLEIEEKAKAAGLTVNLIIDAGLTEFHGVPTRTCLAIGPDRADKIDKITGGLKLL
jgi:PTH2 family peptidyl-tRNA hydrolase